MAALKQKVLDAILARSAQEAAEKEVSERPAINLRLLRRHKRTPLKVRAIFHSGLASKPTFIRDLSNGGLGLSPADGLSPGSSVTVALITGEKKHGIVRWWLAGSCGVQFHEQLEDNDTFMTAVLRKAVDSTD
ncbi:MAG TPA: PilZ domain-containing protein [Hyphomicrobiaceae bacterium]|nr:PilZ domain-containing protein [Hyphomicrobiaceae bacterium]